MKRKRLAFTIPERTAEPSRAATAERISTRWQNAAKVTEGIQAAANEFLVYGDIGESWYSEGITAKGIRAWLDERRGQDVSIRVNSPGGDVFEGVGIHNALAQHDGKVTVHVDALAASAASIIAMAGDEINIAANAMIMVHRAWTWTAGNANDLEKEASLLRKIDTTLVDTYVARTGQESADVEAMLDAETWLTAQEAKDKGFADAITAAKAPPAPPSPEPDPSSVEARKAQFAEAKRLVAALSRK